jgi:ABC-2 type transport system permease protein
VVPGKAMYLRRHRLTAARQRLTITVPRKPGHAGVDPRSLLVDLRQRDNFVDLAPPPR